MNLRVLLADDEEAIVHVYSVGLGHYFARAEYDPLRRADLTMCRQGDEAVELVREALDAGEPFDVVVLDVRMPPGIDGVEAARRIRALMPCVQILFVSGFSDYGRSELEELVPPATQMDYVEKPVRLSVLADKIISAAERARSFVQADSSNGTGGTEGGPNGS